MAHRPSPRQPSTRRVVRLTSLIALRRVPVGRRAAGRPWATRASADRALRHRRAGRTQGLPRRACRRHPELPLPPVGFGFWCRLDAVRPQATLFDDAGRQTMTHYLSPNPDEGGTARATWQHSRDTSAVWGLASASSTDPAFVAPGAIPWLLVRVTGNERGPSGGAKLVATKYIQRVNTAGGRAPATGCATPGDLGAHALVPYTTDYYFFKAIHPAHA